jgi:hypothetical protein
VGNQAHQARQAGWNGVNPAKHGLDDQQALVEIALPGLDAVETAREVFHVPSL